MLYLVRINQLPTFNNFAINYPISSMNGRTYIAKNLVDEYNFQSTLVCCYFASQLDVCSNNTYYNSKWKEKREKNQCICNAPLLCWLINIIQNMCSPCYLLAKILYDFHSYYKTKTRRPNIVLP